MNTNCLDPRSQPVPPMPKRGRMAGLNRGDRDTRLGKISGKHSGTGRQLGRGDEWEGEKQLGSKHSYLRESAVSSGKRRTGKGMMVKPRGA